MIKCHLIEQRGEERRGEETWAICVESGAKPLLWEKKGGKCFKRGSERPWLTCVGETFLFWDILWLFYFNLNHDPYRVFVCIFISNFLMDVALAVPWRGRANEACLNLSLKGVKGAERHGGRRCEGGGIRFRCSWAAKGAEHKHNPGPGYLQTVDRDRTPDTP